MPIGPLALADEVGLDVGYKVLKVLNSGYGERFKISSHFDDAMNDDQFLGKKSGIGFYKYDKRSQSLNYDLYKKYSIVMKHRISDQMKLKLLIV